MNITLVFVYPRGEAKREQSYEIADIIEFREAVKAFCKDIIRATGLKKIVNSKIAVAKWRGNQVDEWLYLKDKLPFDFTKFTEYHVAPYMIM